MRHKRHTLSALSLPTPARPNLYVGVSQQLRALISERKLRPGDRIPSERTLAQHLRVGRPVVRDALRTLEALGLIHVVPRQGSFVKELTLDPYFQFWGDALLATGNGDRVLLESVCEAQRIVEGEIAALAAERASPEEITALDETAASLRRATRSPDRCLRAMEALTQVLTTGAHNPILLQIREGLSRILQKVLARAFTDPTVREQAVTRYRRIVEAVRGRQSPRAREEMTIYLKDLQGHLTQALEIRQTEKTPWGS